MQQLKQLLIDQLQDLLHAETQLTGALPKMAEAAHHPKLKEAFMKHLTQTEEHVQRLRDVFEALGADAKPKTCKAMMGLVEEGKETIQESASMDPLSADLALIAAAQRVEHYEISAYGTARTLAKQMGAKSACRLLSYTLGDEEATDYLLTAISEPLLQQMTLNDVDGEVNLESVGAGATERRSASSSQSTRKSNRGAA